MAAAYHTDTLLQRYHNRTLLIENLTPDYPPQEREAVKKQIEERLYDVFSRYAPAKPRTPEAAPR